MSKEMDEMDELESWSARWLDSQISSMWHTTFSSFEHQWHETEGPIMESLSHPQFELAEREWRWFNDTVVGVINKFSSHYNFLSLGFAAAPNFLTQTTHTRGFQPLLPHSGETLWMKLQMLPSLPQTFFFVFIHLFCTCNHRKRSD